MQDFLYNELNKAWKTTCKVLFKEEIGELKEYEGWLSEYAENPIKINSNSNKEVFTSSTYRNLRVMDYNELVSTKKIKLDINQIKDIDSIIEALREIFIYSGNSNLGKNNFISKSSEIMDSMFVLNSINVYRGKYIGYSSYLRDVSYTFGSHEGGQASFVIRNVGFGGGGSTRLFESKHISHSSSIYYSNVCVGVTEGLFCFYQNGKSHVIGNLELSKEKYYKIKEKLVEDIRTNILDKKFISIHDLYYEGYSENREETINIIKEEIKNIRENEFSFSPIEVAFKTTSKIILKKELENVRTYEKWLTNIPYYKINKIKTITGKEAFSLNNFHRFKNHEKCYINEVEGKLLYNVNLNKKEIEELNMKDIENTKKILAKIYFITQYLIAGKTINNYPNLVVVSSADNYMSPIPVFSEKTAYCLWPRKSKYLFGSSAIYESEFCIRCFNSINIHRGFEIDFSRNSSDIYFSHNVENVIEGMFNFNVKNLSYAIGNVKYDPETYRRIKASLLEQIAGELEEKKDLKWSIYNIGAVE